MPTCTKLLKRNVKFVFDKYANNGRTAIALIDSDNGEPICYLSEDHPEVNDEIIFSRLPEYEAIIIDNDFIACFDSEREAKIWIRDNLPECVITGDIIGRPCFYIKA